MPGAQVRMQPDDARAVLARERAELVDLIERDTELRRGAAGLDLVVMATPDAEIDAQVNVAAGEQRAPLGQWMQRVERDAHAGFERSGVLGARREVRREQDVPGCDARDGGAHGVDFGHRDAFEREAFFAERTQDRWMWIGLQCVEPAVHDASA